MQHKCVAQMQQMHNTNALLHSVVRKTLQFIFTNSTVKS